MSYDWDEHHHVEMQQAHATSFWRGVVFGAIVEGVAVGIAWVVLWSWL